MALEIEINTVVAAVLRDHYGDQYKAAEYCESVALTDGPLSPIYAAAARRIRAQIKE